MQTEDQASADLVQTATTPVQSVEEENPPAIEGVKLIESLSDQDAVDEAVASHDATEETQGDEGDTGTQDDENPDETVTEDEPQISRRSQRVVELNRQLNDARAEAAQYRQHAAQLAQQNGAGQDLDPYQFETDEAWQAAVIQQSVQQSQTQAQASQMEMQAQMAEQRAEAATLAALQERAVEFGSRVPDFQETMQTVSTLPSNPAMTEGIASSEKGPEILYFLGKNPGEAHRIAALPPQQALMALGQLEGRLSVAPAKRVSSAPAPVKKVAGQTAVAQKTPAEMTPKEYFAYRNRQAGIT